MTPIRLLIAVGAVVAAFAALVPISHARTACVDRILDEWVHPSKPIATTHALKCYDLSLKEAPEDVLLYTNFETDVRAAKQQAIRRNRAEAEKGNANTNPPVSPPSSPTPPPAAPPPPSADLPLELDPAPGEPIEELPQPELVLESAQPPVDPTTESDIDPLGVGEPAQTEDVVGIDEPVEIAPVDSEAIDAPVIDVLRNIGPDDARSVPVPLIVLTILSGLLAIIGATLLAARHVQSRRMAEGPPLPARKRQLGENDLDI